VSSDRSAQHLALVRDLDRRDADVAERLGVVHDVLARVDGVREDATRVRTGLEAIPAEIEHAERDERDSREREAAARQELAEAEAALERLRDSRRASDEARVQAERAVQRAATAVSDCVTSVARHRERIEVLVRDEAALQAAGEGLAVEAHHVAAAVDAVPRLSGAGRVAPGTSLPEIEEWAARAHAALFVVRGSLEAERERLVLEANGLAAAALGDHTGNASVALVRRRLEERLGP
jgi:chromosome segregation ATPase